MCRNWTQIVCAGVDLSSNLVLLMSFGPPSSILYDEGGLLRFCEAVFEAALRWMTWPLNIFLFVVSGNARYPKLSEYCSAVIHTPAARLINFWTVR